MFQARPLQCRGTAHWQRSESPGRPGGRAPGQLRARAGDAQLLWASHHDAANHGGISVILTAAHSACPG